MIIRSQDKKTITTDLNLEIFYPDFNGDRWEISNNTVGTIAEYSTEEKAIKVLDMIQDAYVKPDMWAEYSCKEMIIHNKSVFQMPADEDVEV